MPQAGVSAAIPTGLPAAANPGTWGTLPDDQRAILGQAFDAFQPPSPPAMDPGNQMPQGFLESLAATLGPNPFQIPQGNFSGGPGAYFLTWLASGFGNALSNRGAMSYRNRIAQQQAQQEQAKATYDAQVKAARAGQTTVFDQGLSAALRKPAEPAKRYPIMQNDWRMLKGAQAIPKAVEDEYVANGGTLSEPAYRSVQAAIDNLRATQNAARTAKGSASATAASGTDYSTDQSVSSLGVPYLPNRYTAKEAGDARAWARQNGIRFVSKDASEALDNINTAVRNLSDFRNELNPILPSGTGVRGAAAHLVRGNLNRLEAATQFDPEKASVGALRTAAIQAMRAAAGSKGLRINRAEILMSAQNDLPQLSDTRETAEWRFQRMMTILQNAERDLLGQPLLPMPNRKPAGDNGGALPPGWRKE